MPQMNKGGKFIFGKSLIKEDGTIQIPPQERYIEIALYRLLSFRNGL